MPAPPPFEARLVSARTLGPSVRELTFERVDGQPAGFQPGQWFNAILPVGPGEPISRSYSIASEPDGSPRFALAVTHVRGGPASTWLHELTVGAALRFVGPFGFFTRPAVGGPPSLMIATGTGVTPLRSMVRAAVLAGSQAPMWILLGVRHEEDLLYRDEFDALAREHACVRFEPTLSQGSAAWTGRRGYVQTHVRELWEALRATGAGEPHAYVCGLERMVGSVRAMMKTELGAPRQQVHGERYD